MNFTTTGLLGILATTHLLYSSHPAQAQTQPHVKLPAPTVDSPVSLIQNGNFTELLDGNWHAGGPLPPQVEVFHSEKVPGGTAARLITALKPGCNVWDARFASPKTSATIERNSLIGITFWARSPQSNSLAVMYQLSEDPFPKCFSRVIPLTPEWTQFRYVGQADRPYGVLPTGEHPSNFEFHVGYGNGIIELADVHVDNYGKSQLSEVEKRIGPQTIDYWAGQAHPDNWRASALARIEKFRKADLEIEVTDADGHAIPGASLQIVQTRQQFHWGTCIIEDRLINDNSPDNARYRQELKRLFNTVVFEGAMKWALWQQTSAEIEEANRAGLLGRVDGALKWLHENNFEVRGHNLAWGAKDYVPLSVADLPPDQLRAALQKHVADYAGRFKGQVYVWDVVNEAATNHWLWDKLGWEDFANMYRWTRQADPTVKLAYNDYNICNESDNPPARQAQRANIAYKVRYLMDHGAPLDIVGDQSHIGVPLTPIHRVLELWDEAASWGKPLEITEFDAGIADDELHGQYVRDFMIAAYSQPQVQSFIMWGFWEGSHWRASQGGAMFRRDWSKRPAALAYEDLVLKQWKTNLNELSDEGGRLKTRGFLGEYTATVRRGNQEKSVNFTLTKDGVHLRIAL